MVTIGYTLYSSQVNLMDGKQGIEKSFNAADGSLTQALNGVAGTAGEVQWAVGTIQAVSQWASTNTDPKMAAALGKIATSANFVGGTANVWLLKNSIEANGLNGSETGTLLNGVGGVCALTEVGLVVLGAAGLVVIGPEVLLAMGVLNALALGFTTAGLMSGDGTVGEDLVPLLREFFTMNPDALGRLTPMELAKLRQLENLYPDDGHNGHQGLPTPSELIPFNPQREINPDVNSLWHSFKNWTAPIIRRDPLVLDLDGDGIETLGITSTTSNNQNFNHTKRAA